MKTLLLIATFLFNSSLLKAQDSTIVLSKYEAYCTSQGRLIKTSTTTIGEVRSVSIDVLITTDVRKGDTISVIRLSPIWGSGVKPLIANNIIYLEKEEVTEIIALLQYYAAEIKNENAKQFLYSYITNGDVSIGCNYNEGIFSSTWLSFRKIYKYLRTPVQESLWFGRRDIDILIQVLQSAQQRL